MIRQERLESDAGKRIFAAANIQSKRTGTAIHSIALRYALERFLHRLFETADPGAERLLMHPDSSVGIDRSTITLKGGLTMTFAERVHPLEGRTTGDADLHLAAFEGSMQDFADILKRILAQTPDGVDDGLRFDTDGIAVRRDREERSGGSVTIPVQLGLYPIQIKTDVTFDARPMHDVAPFLEYPTVLPVDGLTTVRVRRVPWEFMLADKISAAFENGMDNKRVRDFADMRLVLANEPVDDAYLAETLAATMRFKGASLPRSMDEAPGFSDAFAKAKEERWSHERINKRFQVAEELSVLIPWVRERLQPVLELAHGIDPLPEWSHGPR